MSSLISNRLKTCTFLSFGPFNVRICQFVALVLVSTPTPHAVHVHVASISIRPNIPSVRIVVPFSSLIHNQISTVTRVIARINRYLRAGNGVCEGTQECPTQSEQTFEFIRNVFHFYGLEWRGTTTKCATSSGECFRQFSYQTDAGCTSFETHLSSQIDSRQWESCEERNSEFIWWQATNLFYEFVEHSWSDDIFKLSLQHSCHSLMLMATNGD